MPTQLEQFQQWIEKMSEADHATTIADFDLETQLSAYTRTFPGRTLPLLVELAKAALSNEKESNE